MKRPLPNIYKKDANQSKSVNGEDGNKPKSTPDNDDDSYGSRLPAGQPPTDQKIPLYPPRAPPPQPPSNLSGPVSNHLLPPRAPPPPPPRHSHHTMTKIVFLQKILPFAATKKKSSAIFKSVSSSWEETIVHYSGAVLCLKAYVESQEELLSRDDNSPKAPTHCVALQMLLRGLRRWPRCPLLPIDTLFDVCDLLGAQFTEEHAVYLIGELEYPGLLDRQQPSPFEMLISSSFECHRVGIRNEEEASKSTSTSTLIHYFQRLLKLFGDHENNKYRGYADGTSADHKEQQAKNEFIRKVLRSTDLLAFATRHVSVEVLEFLVSTFRRIGGRRVLLGQLQHLGRDTRNSVLDEALARGDLDKLRFFVDTIIGMNRTGDRFGSLWFSSICHYFNNKPADASLLGAMCHYPLASTSHAKYLMENLRTHGGDEEVKKQLEFNPWTEMDLRAVTASPLMMHEAERWRTFHARCAIHFACEFGNREKLLYVLDLAKGFGDEYFKKYIVVPGCRFVSELPPLHYALRNVTEGSVDVLECYVEHLLAHVGEEALVKQLKNIRKRSKGLHSKKFKKDNVEGLLKMIRERNVCDTL